MILKYILITNTSILAVAATAVVFSSKCQYNVVLLDPLDSPVHHYQYQPLATSSPEGGQG